METNSSLSNTQDSITNDDLTTFYSRRSEVIMGAAFILLAVVGKQLSTNTQFFHNGKWPVSTLTKNISDTDHYSIVKKLGQMKLPNFEIRVMASCQKLGIILENKKI